MINWLVTWPFFVPSHSVKSGWVKKPTKTPKCARPCNEKQQLNDHMQQKVWCLARPGARNLVITLCMVANYLAVYQNSIWWCTISASYVYAFSYIHIMWKCIMIHSLIARWRIHYRQLFLYNHYLFIQLWIEPLLIKIMITYRN